jgi:hypothetical protein
VNILELPSAVMGLLRHQTKQPVNNRYRIEGMGGASPEELPPGAHRTCAEFLGDLKGVAVRGCGPCGIAHGDDVAAKAMRPASIRWLAVCSANSRAFAIAASASSSTPAAPAIRRAAV